MAPSSHHIDNRHDDVIVENQLRGIPFRSYGLAAIDFDSVLLELIYHHDGRLIDVLRAITSEDTIEVSVL